jgi:hypothetical protein
MRRGWSVTYEQDGVTRALRIDEMMNALCSSTVDAVPQMHLARRVELGELPDRMDASLPRLGGPTRRPEGTNIACVIAPRKG